jgi:hypothetical protein
MTLIQSFECLLELILVFVECSNLGKLLSFISSFSMSDKDVPAEFDPHFSSPVMLSSPSLDDELHRSTFDSILSSLIKAFVDGPVDYCQKMLLDSALHSLVGVYDYNFLKSAFGNSKGGQGILKQSCPCKFALVLDRIATQCMEHLRRSDPRLSSFTVPDLLSFIVKGMCFPTIFIISFEFFFKPFIS